MLVPSLVNAQSLSGSQLRITPLTLPAKCRLGDVRVDSGTSNLEFCSATNTWSAVVANTATITSLPNLATIGTVTTGSWAASKIRTQYGGTGQDLSASTGILHDVAGTVSTSSVDLSVDTTNTLPVAKGGTGQTAVGNGQILIGNNTGSTFNVGTITAGANITVTNGAGSITIAGSGSVAPAYNFVSQTSTYSATINDWVVASSASYVVTLPTAASQTGKSIVVQHNGTSLTQVYSIATTSGQTINGPNGTVTSGSYALYTTGEVLKVQSDGSNWQVVEHKTDNGWTNSGTIAFTATSGGTSTGTYQTNRFIWRRTGNIMQASLDYVHTVAGTAGTGLYLIGIPGSQTLDTTVIQTNGASTSSAVGSNLGTCNISNQANGFGAATVIATMFAYDSTHLAIREIAGAGSNTYNLLNNATAPGTLSTANLSISCEMPKLTMSNWQP